MEFKLVKVKWEDTEGIICWKTVKEAKKWAEENNKACYTTGWLLEKNKKYIIVAATRDTDDEDMGFNNLSRIPIYNVQKITEIKCPEQK